MTEEGDGSVSVVHGEMDALCTTGSEVDLTVGPITHYFTRESAGHPFVKWDPPLDMTVTISPDALRSAGWSGKTLFVRTDDADRLVNDVESDPMYDISTFCVQKRTRTN